MASNREDGDDAQGDARGRGGGVDEHAGERHEHEHHGSPHVGQHHAVAIPSDEIDLGCRIRLETREEGQREGSA